jgi:hypothetical protein
MNRWTLLQISLLSLAYSLATVLLGWWAVPLVACVWGVYEKEELRPALIASVSAGLGWALLLAWTALSGPAMVLSERAAGVMGAPGITLIALTLLFPMALAWGAGVLGGIARYVWERWRSGA